MNVSSPKLLKWVKSPNFGVFGGQSQIKVDSNPELYESSLEANEIIWNHQVLILESDKIMILWEI